MQTFNIKGNPITLALINQLSSTREQKRAYSEPVDEINDESSTVINLALRHVLSDQSYIPTEMANDLTTASKYVYKIESFVFIIASFIYKNKTCNYINGTCIYIIKAFIYRLQTAKRNFAQGRKELFY